jgi:hypothetical protein
MPADALSPLPAEAATALDEYLTALDRALPGNVTGVYVTGSAVLGDWQPGLLARAKAHRRGDDTTTFTVADGREACDLIDAVADDAARLRTR